MAENALKKSRDLNELKKFRGAIKGQVTSALNKLEALFAQKVADDYDHNRIFVPEVNQVEAKLKDRLDLFLKLHDRGCRGERGGCQGERVTSHELEAGDGVKDPWYEDCASRH